MRSAATRKDDKSEARHPPGLENVARNATAFQRREWIWQRVGWILLALLLLAGAAGVFGNGPLADATLDNAVASLKYERFVRRDADTRWELTLRDVPAGGTADIAIDAAFAAHFEITAIQPEPSSAFLSDGRWVYRFDIRDGGEQQVVFILQPERVGRHAGSIEVAGAPPFTLSQLTYP
jgi:hypothetical protein